MDARHNPLPTHLEPALRIYALAQKYGVRPGALQTAQTILKHASTIEDLEDMLDIIPGASLYELWKYHERVRTTLASDLEQFRKSGARGTITGSWCTDLSSSRIPRWLDQYIESIVKTPKLFHTGEFSIIMARHIADKAVIVVSCECESPDHTTRSTPVSCKCVSMSNQTIRDFWDALETVIHGSFEKVSVIDV